MSAMLLQDRFVAWTGSTRKHLLLRLTHLEDRHAIMNRHLLLQHQYRHISQFWLFKESPNKPYAWSAVTAAWKAISAAVYVSQKAFVR